MSKEKLSYYFSHDSGARRDLRIQSMRTVYGTEGYGLFWMIVELLSEQADFKLPLNGKFSMEIYSKECGTTVETIERFIQDCISEFQINGHGLFESDGEYFWSESLRRRLQRLDDFRRKLSAAGRKGAESRWGLHDDPNGQAIASPSLGHGHPIACKGNKGNKENDHFDPQNDPLGPSFDHRFGEFWNVYPRKVSKKRSRQVWQKVSPTDEVFEEIMSGLRRYIDSEQWQKEGGKYIPHPATFLNQERWKDEIEAPKGVPWNVKF